jgi:hypothetical protein
VELINSFFFCGEILPFGNFEKKRVLTSTKEFYWGKNPPNLPYFLQKKVEITTFRLQVLAIFD